MNALDQMPAPPQGVAIIDRDGDAWPVELVYMGVTSEGVDIWRITSRHRYVDVTGVRVGSAPSNCRIVVNYR